MSSVEPETFSTPDQAATEWLPAWFVPRMMEGNGGLSLYLSTGKAIPIERIDRVHRACDGSVWLDILLTLPDYPTDRRLGLPATEAMATVNAAHVTMAFISGDFDPRSTWDIGTVGATTEFKP